MEYNVSRITLAVMLLLQWAANNSLNSLKSDEPGKLALSSIALKVKTHAKCFGDLRKSWLAESKMPYG